MASPFLNSLSRNARAAYPIIVSGVRRGMSSRAIERSIKRAGLPINRSRDILPTMRAVRDLEKAGETVKNVGKSKVINTSRLPPAITNIRRQFSYRVRVVGVDDNGFRTERIINVSTDERNLTPKDIEDEARSVVEDSNNYSIPEVESVKIEFGMQRADLSDPDFFI